MILSTLFLVAAAQTAPAPDPGACAQVCDGLAERFQQSCDQDCANLPWMHDECMATCTTPLAIPGEDGLRAIADAFAVDRWGYMTLIDVQPYLGGDGQPRSVLFVYSQSGDIGTPEDIRQSVIATDYPVDGTDLRCVEVGAHRDAPPIVGFWEGMPLEYSAHGMALDDLGPNAHLVARHGPAAFPVFEYEVDGSRIFWEARTRKFGDRFTRPDASSLENEERWQIRRAELNFAWQRVLREVVQ